MSDKVKNVRNLEDEELDSVVGGAVTGSYMTGLGDYIDGGRFSFSYGKFKGNSMAFESFSASQAAAANDRTFATMIRRAEEYGGIVMMSKSGQAKRFSADELKKFL